MEIRKTTTEDLSEILAIYDGARAFMRTVGNASQWTNGYPGEAALLEDIRGGNSYVCVGDNDTEDTSADAPGGVQAKIDCVFSLIYGEDPTYLVIREGRWLNDRPYATIHRLAARVNRRGVAAFCLDWCYRQCGNLRVDTHQDNLPMRRLLEKTGFQYCGLITLPDGCPRLAFQKGFNAGGL